MAVGYGELFDFVEGALGRAPTEPVHEAGGFGGGEEVVGEGEAEFGMIPAGESFDTGYDAGSNVDLRLVIKDKLLAFEGALEVFVRYFKLQFFSRNWCFRSKVRGEHVLKLRDGKRLLKMPDHGESEGLGEFF